jgi:hypothetical protein
MNVEKFPSSIIPKGGELYNTRPPGYVLSTLSIEVVHIVMFIGIIIFVAGVKPWFKK